MFFAPSKLIHAANILNMDLKETSDHIQIKIKIQSPRQEPPASSKAPNEDFKDMDVLGSLKIKIEGKNIEHRSTKDQWPYTNQDQDAKPQTGTSRVIWSSKWGIKIHGCSLHLQNQYKEPNVRSLVYHRPVTISKSRLRSQTQVRILQQPQKPEKRT